MNIVCMGAGAGLPLLLRGLTEFARRQPSDALDDAIRTTAIVFPADDGDPATPPSAAFLPGTASTRDCLVALSRASLLADVFRYHLPLDSNAAQHCVGDLILAALVSRNSTLAEAAQLASSLLQCAGRVIPVTESAAIICAEFEDGRQARGSTEINAARQPIRRAWLDPLDPPASPGVIQSILDADSVVLGPASLFTDIVSNLLIAGVCEALRESPAVKILAVNLFNEAGQTAGLPASGYVRILEEHLGRGTINICLINSRPVPARSLEELALHGCTSLDADESSLVELGAVPVFADLLRETSGTVEHDPAKLAQSVIALTRAAIRAREFSSGGIGRAGPKEASAGSPET